MSWFSRVKNAFWKIARAPGKRHTHRCSKPPTVAHHDNSSATARIVPAVTCNDTRYTLRSMIRSFRCTDTQALLETGRCKRFGAVAKIAVRKLAQLDAAETLDFLRAPSGDLPESLKGDRKGQHSIRINDQYRICFRGTADGPEQVEIVDYLNEE
jgi:proteic killer suppression protein